MDELPKSPNNKSRSHNANEYSDLCLNSLSMNKSKIVETNGHSKNSGSTIELQNILLNNDENSKLKMQILIQNKLLKNYESCVNTLLKVIGNKNTEMIHVDLSTPIQKLLEKIESISKENLKIKEENLAEINKGNVLNQKLTNLREERHIMHEEYLNENEETIKQERDTLVDNLQFIANELDEQSEKCKNLQNFIYNDNYGQFSSYEKNMNELNNLKQQNLNLKRIIEIQQHQKCMNNKQEPKKIVNLKTFGNYTLEQEEYFEKSNGVISC